MQVEGPFERLLPFGRGPRGRPFRPSRSMRRGVSASCSCGGRSLPIRFGVSVSNTSKGSASLPRIASCVPREVGAPVGSCACGLCLCWSSRACSRIRRAASANVIASVRSRLCCAMMPFKTAESLLPPPLSTVVCGSFMVSTISALFRYSSAVVAEGSEINNRRKIPEDSTAADRTYPFLPRSLVGLDPSRDPWPPITGACTSPAIHGPLYSI